MTTFKLRIRWSSVDYDYPVLNDAVVDGVQKIQHHGMPVAQNKVILRGGLQYDEAWLCLAPMNMPPLDATGAPFDSNFLARRLNESYPMSIVIGGWETNNWRCANTWKISCGSNSVWLCRFVDLRYVLCEFPAPANLAVAASSMGVTTIRGTARTTSNTVEFQKAFGTGSLEEALTKVLLGGGTLFGGSTDYHELRIGAKGTWKPPWSDVTWAPLVGHFSDISTADKSTLHYAQYLLDHYLGMLVRGYTSPDSDEQESVYDIVSWTSGSTPTGPYLCSWDSPRPTSGTTHGPSLPVARYYRRNWTNGAGSVQNPIAGVGTTASLPFSTGRVRRDYEYSDLDDSVWPGGAFTGSFSFTPLGESIAYHLNRNREGYTVAGYQSGAPTGKFDTIVFEKATTTYIRQAVPRPEYRPQPMGQVYLAIADGAIAVGATGPATVLHETIAGSLAEEATIYNRSGTALVNNDEIVVFKPIQTMGFQRVGVGAGTRYIFAGDL